MNKKERVKAAIRKEKVDYVPSCFSLHFPRETAFGEDAVKAHLEFYHATDTDILKVMNENLIPDIGPVETAVGRTRQNFSGCTLRLTLRRGSG